MDQLRWTMTLSVTIFYLVFISSVTGNRIRNERDHDSSLDDSSGNKDDEETKTKSGSELSKEKGHTGSKENKGSPGGQSASSQQRRDDSKGSSQDSTASDDSIKEKRKDKEGSREFKNDSKKSNSCENENVSKKSKGHCNDNSKQNKHDLEKSESRSRETKETSSEKDDKLKNNSKEKSLGKRKDIDELKQKQSKDSGDVSVEHTETKIGSKSSEKDGNSGEYGSTKANKYKKSSKDVNNPRTDISDSKENFGKKREDEVESEGIAGGTSSEVEDDRDSNEKQERRLSRKPRSSESIWSSERQSCSRGRILESTNMCVWINAWKNKDQQMHQGQKECLKNDGILFRPYNMTFVEDMMKAVASVKSGKITSYWIGLIKDGSSYKWTDGTTPSWFYWSENTSKENKHEECVVAVVSDNHRWKDEKCNKKHTYICQPSSVDGNWSEWEAWSDCSVTCDNGKQTRTRTCNAPPPSVGGQECRGDKSETQPCSSVACRVDGNWSEWAVWSDCSVTCGNGKQSRTRTCSAPSPSGGGRECNGNNSEKQSCSSVACAVDGNWSEWGAWSDCSVTCGNGKQSRTRTCSAPSPSGGGQECNGNNSEKQSCSSAACAVDGSWSKWGAWSDCSVTCGNGKQSRTRTCSAPSPSGGGQECNGNNSEKQSCSSVACAVDGSWSEWGAWSDCSVTCGNGKQSRTRTCSAPSPSGGGQECNGNNSEKQSCSSVACAVNGTWSEWQEWSHCSVTCGNGQKARSRACNNPAPSHGGDTCPGQRTESSQCSKGLCPVDGKWSEWEAWSDCSVTCGDGKQTRTRLCSAPSPSGGGQECSGNNSEKQSCNSAACAENEAWSEWQDWSQCSVSCGKGQRARSRVCNNPSPSRGGDTCSGQETESSECFMGLCPVNGAWSEWQEWSECSVGCGTGQKTRSRVCNKPAPSNGGKTCAGQGTESGKCSMGICPVDGNWSEWGAWSDCSVTCGNGKQSRTRTCSAPLPSGGGRECSGNDSEKQSCSSATCAVNGAWSEWHEWSECSVTCGKGQKTRSRDCNNPTPSEGGETCPGKSTDSSGCSMGVCPVDGNWAVWAEWSDCSVTCGNGKQSRTRTCNAPSPSGGGQECSGDNSEEQSCSCVACTDLSRLKGTLFEIAKEDYGLRGCELDIKTNTSLVECALDCVHREGCKSFNFEYKWSSPTSRNSTCVLNFASRMERLEDFVPMPDYQLYSIGLVS